MNYKHLASLGEVSHVRTVVQPYFYPLLVMLMVIPNNVCRCCWEDCTLVYVNNSSTWSRAIILLKRVQNNPKYFFIASSKKSTNGRKQIHSFIIHRWIIDRQPEVLSHIQANSNYHLVSQPIFCQRKMLFTSLSIASISGVQVMLLTCWYLHWQASNGVSLKHKSMLGRQMEYSLEKANRCHKINNSKQKMGEGKRKARPLRAVSCLVC